MVVRTENIETQKTECLIFHETETFVCLFDVSFFRFLLFFFLFVYLVVFFFVLPRSIHHLAS